jgi:D-alanyl-D-alanine carboxypeptidase/D-alanyl-D-alanine-endopeptidase (penicillin-binding protein 4)
VLGILVFFGCKNKLNLSMRFYTIGFLFLLLCVPFWAQNSLQSALLKLQQDPSLKGSKWSICAYDTQTKDTIVSWNADLALPGASITKLFSTAAALSVLGPEAKAQTRIYIDGAIDNNGLLHGNIWLKGEGDVSLGSRYFNDPGTEFQFIDTWVEVIKSAGIKAITGSVIADAESFGYEICPVGWERADMGNYYGCGAYGLNFYDNTLKLSFKTGALGTPIQLVSIFPNDYNYKLSIEAKAAAISNDQSYIHGIPFDDQRKITGALPANQASFIVKASMPDPERLLAQLVYEKLQVLGIRVDGGSSSKRMLAQNPDYAAFHLIHSHFAEPIEKVVYWTNQRSVNLFAEGLLRQVGYQYYGFGSYENGLKVLDSLNKSWGIGEITIVDGSGLSKENKISARQFVHLLLAQKEQSYFSSYYNSLPIAGESGTVKSLCAGQVGSGKIHAKSGSINGIKAYSGYIETLEGHQIAFAIIANAPHLSGAALSKKMEPLLNAVVSQITQPE